MKYIVIFLLQITSITNAQKPANHFKLANSEISWQKVYETTKTKTQLIQYFEETGNFFSYQVIADTIFAKLKPQSVDPKITGVAGVPKLVNNEKYKGDVRIELKDKKYRVTFSHLKIVGSGEIVKKNQTQTFEENYLTSTGGYRNFFLKKPRDVYNYWFNTIFEIKAKKKDDW